MKQIHENPDSNIRVSRRSLISGVVSLVALGATSVIAQESDEKQEISLQGFIDLLNAYSTHEASNNDQFVQSWNNNIALIQNFLGKYDLLDDEIEGILGKFLEKTEDPYRIIQEIRKELLTRNLFLNLDNEVVGGMLFQNCEQGFAHISNSSVIQNLFGDDISDIHIPTITIEDPSLSSLGLSDPNIGIIILNSFRISQAYAYYTQAIGKVRNPVFGNQLTQDAYFNYVLVNELAHGVLDTKYGFNSSTEIPWSNEIGTNHPLISFTNSRTVGEFLSDLVSLISGPIAQTFALLLRKNILTPHPGYQLSDTILRNHILDILSSKQLSPAGMKAQRFLSGERIVMTNDELFFGIVENISSEDIGEIVNNFFNVGKYLFSIIRKYSLKP